MPFDSAVGDGIGLFPIAYLFILFVCVSRVSRCVFVFVSVFVSVFDFTNLPRTCCIL